jgi:outer membrane protein OmpA-like peptidoglycan-associated protein
LGGAMFYLHKKNGTRLKYLSTANGTYSFVNDGKNEIDSVLIQFINYQDVWFKVPPTSTNKECVDTISFPIVLKIKQGIEFIRLDMVLYNFDKYELRPEGKEELDKLVQYMKERPDLRVELSSHTDSRGASEYNIELSNNRSQSCVNYIISNGISAKMITAKGYGESKLVNQCADGVPCSEEEHQANRRTELRFLTTENEILDTEKLEKK